MMLIARASVRTMLQTAFFAALLLSPARSLIEEKTLRETLPGYGEYMQRFVIGSLFISGRAVE